jgi:DNA-binding LacI/PurR family transcriptional regulator
MWCFTGPLDPDLDCEVDNRTSSTEERISQVLDDLLRLKDRPTAILTVNDHCAFLAIRDLEARGLNVPNDMSIMGCDDIERFLPMPRRLTTMHIPFDRIGYRAAELLLNRISAGPEANRCAPKQHIMLPTRLNEGLTVRKL